MGVVITKKLNTDISHLHGSKASFSPHDTGNLTKVTLNNQEFILRSRKKLGTFSDQQ
jgi:hypothetical protein